MSDEKKIELRSFEIDDLDLVLEIIDSIGIEEFKSCFKEVKVEKNKENIDVVSVGVDIAFEVIAKVIKNAKKCLDPLYQLFAKLSGLDIEAAKKMNLFKFSSELIKLVQREDCKDFLKLVSSLKK